MQEVYWDVLLLSRTTPIREWQSNRGRGWTVMLLNQGVSRSCRGSGAGIWSKGVRTLWPPIEQSLDVGYSQGGHLPLGKVVLFITQLLEHSIPYSQDRKQVPWSWKGHPGSTVQWSLHAVNSVPRLSMGSHLQQITPPLWISVSSAIK